MKKIILSGILSVLVISGLVVTVQSLAFGAKDSAEGSGTLVNQDGTKSEFSFDAKRNPNGKVTGKATIRNPSYKTGNGQFDKIKIDITCLKIVGNVALIGGMGKRKNSQTKAEAFYFAVQDNGSAGAIFRGFYYDDDPATDGDPMQCEKLERDILVLEPIVSGNIKVSDK